MDRITVQVIVNESIEKVWGAYTVPEHVMRWNHASDDWHSPRATNDLRVGGMFNYRMEAKDGSEGFDFTGTYTEVIPEKRIAFVMDDGRTVAIEFEEMGNGTVVTITFDPEKVNTVELQRSGWQAILDNFKAYTEQL